jgi:hypothetical protein
MDSSRIAFDDTVGSSQGNPTPAYEEKMNAVEALKYIDDRWYKTVAGKKARWMDLIGDYAGNERFTLDGKKNPCLFLEDLTTACPQGSHCCNTFSMTLCWHLHVLMVSPFAM